jgi:hypothetical protein
MRNLDRKAHNSRPKDFSLAQTGFSWTTADSGMSRQGGQGGPFGRNDKKSIGC